MKIGEEEPTQTGNNWKRERKQEKKKKEKKEGVGKKGGEGNGTPLQYSCLGNPVDGGAW